MTWFWCFVAVNYRGYFAYEDDEKGWFSVSMIFNKDNTFHGHGTDEVGDFQFKNGTKSGEIHKHNSLYPG